MKQGASSAEGCVPMQKTQGLSDEELKPYLKNRQEADKLMQPPDSQAKSSSDGGVAQNHLPFPKEQTPGPAKVPQDTPIAKPPVVPQGGPIEHPAPGSGTDESPNLRNTAPGSGTDESPNPRNTAPGSGRIESPNPRNTASGSGIDVHPHGSVSEPGDVSRDKATNRDVIGVDKSDHH